MPKPKPPTPQELYRAKKQREEREREAYLPPGLINHGNTCFMNSVLQGLIATRLLSDLVHFNPIPLSIQWHSSIYLASRKSPQLTNGHSLAGPYEQPWVNAMPIGDMFLSLVYKAWGIQARRERTVLSPKTLLSTLGQKYEQYLDFAQQDAHEFLRILLDAMRMEEQDIIKKRQISPKSAKKRRRTAHADTLSPDPSNHKSNEIPEEDKLVSFADMIFGGKLTSILVCQKCKHVSQTYEDFNDISLSIKAEDYAHGRKRDRLKNFAKKLTTFPTTNLAVGMEIQRSLSVPPSPHEREGGHDDHILSTPPRRRSLDIASEPPPHDPDSGNNTSKEDSGTGESDSSHIPTINEADESPSVLPSDGRAKEKEKEKKSWKENHDDGWAKIGRRISMSVGLGKPKERKSRSIERESIADLVQKTKRTSKETLSSTPQSSTPSLPRVSVSDVLSPPSTALPKFRSPKQSDAVSNLATLPSVSSLAPSVPRFSTNVHRNKSPKPPQPSRAETEYLRKILADITTGTSSNPFAIFKHHQHLGPNGGPNPRSFSGGSSSPHGVWLGMEKLSGVEECLRMFTSVEVLDGENMVGCRRCWKIANGLYASKHDNGTANEDSDSPGIPDEPDADGQEAYFTPTLANLGLPTSMSTPTLFTPNDSSDKRSINSLPISSAKPSPSLKSPKSPLSQKLQTNHSFSTSEEKTPGGLPIPVISTTAPDAPDGLFSPPSLEYDTEGSESSSGLKYTTAFSSPFSSPPLSQNGTIPQPSRPYRHLVNLHHNSSSDSRLSRPPTSLPIPSQRSRPSSVEPDGDTSGSESDSSIETSYSAESSTSQTPQPSVPSDTQSLPPNAQSTSQQKQQRPQKPTKKPKPVIMRPAYKRYLIATPPPVLVIHLKRFQQITKMPLISFSHGFKKLDDFITFPEYLDLTPFLAPKKEDYGLGKKKASKKATKGEPKERCVYRLYAVVVHIGNMLGGHYIAYTALPSPQIDRSSIEKEYVMPSSDPERDDVSAEGSKTTPVERQWAHISDTVVRLTTLEEVLSAKAYICMYERC